MWTYEKRLQFPVKITRACPKTASLVISQFNDPDGELIASMRYLSQCYITSYKEVGGLLTDIGIEKFAHLEMICTIIYQLVKNLIPEQAKTAGFNAYYIDHTTALWPTVATGILSNVCEFQFKGDAITDPHEDPAAEQKARTTYDNLTHIIENSKVRESLRLLRVREIVHFQRFGEVLEKIKLKLDEKNLYYFNPEFDKQFVQNQR